MSNPIVIHAGLPKTGTTYLQQRFVDNRAWLSSHGIHYPTIGQEIGPGHHNLAQRFRGEAIAEPWAQQPFDQCIAAPDAGRRANERVLLSSETFSSLHPKQALELKAALGDREVTYVLYIRRRSALLASRWQTDVQHGLTLTLAEYLTTQLLGVGNVLRIEDAISVAAQTFGMAAVRLIVFEDLVARRIDLFDYFVEHILDLPATSATPAQASKENVSLPPPVIETLRALNAAQSNGSRWIGGPKWHATDRAFVVEAQRYLHNHTDGQALLHDVAAVFEKHAEEFDPSKLDQQWLHRDHEILHACRTQILNAASESQLFEEGNAKPVRSLRPSVLHKHIAPARFAGACRAIEAEIRD